uniref:Uncharacterized protein n=1 Tax=Lepeophtheirus salmonis TaxID=72036 RepID=A0A0K2V4H5_LEPSM
MDCSMYECADTPLSDTGASFESIMPYLTGVKCMRHVLESWYRGSWSSFKAIGVVVPLVARIRSKSS